MHGPPVGGSAQRVHFAGLPTSLLLGFPRQVSKEQSQRDRTKQRKFDLSYCKIAIHAHKSLSIRFASMQISRSQDEKRTPNPKPRPEKPRLITDVDVEVPGTVLTDRRFSCLFARDDRGRCGCFRGRVPTSRSLPWKRECALSSNFPRQPYPKVFITSVRIFIVALLSTTYLRTKVRNFTFVRKYNVRKYESTKVLSKVLSKVLRKYESTSVHVQCTAVHRVLQDNVVRVHIDTTTTYCILSEIKRV